jgi:hypothetical protein
MNLSYNNENVPIFILFGSFLILIGGFMVIEFSPTSDEEWNGILSNDHWDRK